MKKVLPLCITMLFALPLFAQLPTWTSNNSGQEQYTGTYNNYDYELWNQNKQGTATMKVTGDNGQGTNAKGGTFEAEWNNTCNVLFRSGKKWGSSSTQNHTQIGNMTIDFDATWSSNDGARYLSVYGWVYYTSANKPANFSNEIEYYIVQDRGGYDPTSGSSCVKKGTNATIDNIEYGFYMCDRIGQPKLTGNGDFKQFFSVPTNTSKHRQSGRISVSEHFNAWHARGMYMDGPMYEVAMKIESYNCNNNVANGKGSGKVTKNILTIGGTPASSSSGGGGTPTPSSSSGAASTQANNCNNYIGSLPASPNPPANPYTACFKHTDNKCYVCKVSSESDGNTCSSTWVWSNGTNSEGVNVVEDNINKGYWYQAVTCPAGSSSSAAVSSSSRASSSSVASSSSRVSSSSVVVSSSSRASSSSVASSSSTAGSSSSVVSSSSVTGGQQVCGGYQTSFCGGAEFTSVLDNSVAIPSTGSCLFIGDFTAIQPNLNSTVAINGEENTCGNEWGEVEGKCMFNTKPDVKDGGYYVYVKSGTINSYQNNGWQGIVAKVKPTCTTVSSSSSSEVQQNNSSSSSSDDTAEDPSSSSYYTGENTPVIKDLDPVSALHATPQQYYTLKGEPLGSNLPNKPGVYIVKEKYSVKKIVVR